LQEEGGRGKRNASLNWLFLVLSIYSDRYLSLTWRYIYSSAVAKKKSRGNFNASSSISEI